MAQQCGLTKVAHADDRTALATRGMFANVLEIRSTTNQCRQQTHVAPYVSLVELYREYGIMTSGGDGCTAIDCPTLG
jgi:hypothetical protein